MRIVCISDTHGLHDSLTIPDGDVLVHAGDFTSNGKANQVHAFADWLHGLPHANKVVIPGNHDFFCEHSPALARANIERDGGVHLLIDESIEIDGVLFYGSPWQPRFHDWAFNVDRGAAIRKKWDLIPNGVQVLVTHGPPQFYLDRTDRLQHVGCEELASVIAGRLKDLRLSIFGHIHEGYGYYREQLVNGDRLFVNASTCTLKYRPTNPPIVLDLVDGSAKVVL